MPQNQKHWQNLLIADSSPLVTGRLIDMLKDIKRIDKIFTAASYDEAIEVLQKNKTDIVLLDIQITDKKGIELLKYITQHHPKTKVIVQSNLASSYYQRQCKKEGALFFVDKTKDFDKIPALIYSLY